MQVQYKKRGDNKLLVGLYSGRFIYSFFSGGYGCAIKSDLLDPPCKQLLRSPPNPKRIS